MDRSTNKAIAAAQDVPTLIKGLQAANPALAEQLTGKPLLASRTPWGTLAVAGVSWLASRYGLGWDDTTCAVVAGAGVLAGAYAMRAITTSPIAGWFAAKPAA